MKYFSGIQRSLFIFVLLFLALPAQTKAAAPIVNTTQTYTYESMVTDIQQLKSNYPHIIETKVIGKTPYGRDIWAIKLGTGEATVFFNGSHHAREWMTTMINMKMIEEYAKSYQTNTVFEGYRTRDVLTKTSIWFVPMVNPDGVTLQQKGVKAFPQRAHNTILNINNRSYDFKRLKANAQGIDLNRQYPSGWSTIRNNVSYPYWHNHKGTAANQAKETQALIQFTYEINPEIAVSYHSSGRILYWNYKTPLKNLTRDKRLATTFSKITGYELTVPSANPSGGGYSDWFISTFGRPAFTPEIAPFTGNTHVPLYLFPEEWKRNKKVGLWIAHEGHQLWYAKNKSRLDQIAAEKAKKEAEEKAKLELALQFARNELAKAKEEYNNSLASYKTAKSALDSLTDESLKATKQTELNHLKQSLKTKKEALIGLELHPTIGSKKEILRIQKSYIKEIDDSEAEFAYLGHLYQKIGDTDVHVFLGKEEMVFDSPAILHNYRTMIPIRSVSEISSAQIGWNQTTKKVNLVHQQKTLLMSIGQPVVYINDMEQPLDAPPLIKGNRTLVPLRLINDFFGYKTTWQQSGSIVRIYP